MAYRSRRRGYKSKGRSRYTKYGSKYGKLPRLGSGFKRQVALMNASADTKLFVCPYFGDFTVLFGPDQVATFMPLATINASSVFTNQIKKTYNEYRIKKVSLKISMLSGPYMYANGVATPVYTANVPILYSSDRNNLVFSNVGNGLQFDVV